MVCVNKDLSQVYPDQSKFIIDILELRHGAYDKMFDTFKKINWESTLKTYLGTSVIVH